MALFGVLVQGTLEGNQVVTHTLHLPAVTDLIKINQAVNLFKEVASHNASQPLIIESVLCFLPKRVSLYSVVHKDTRHVHKDTRDMVSPIRCRLFEVLQAKPLSHPSISALGPKKTLSLSLLGRFGNFKSQQSILSHVHRSFLEAGAFTGCTFLLGSLGFTYVCSSI